MIAKTRLDRDATAKKEELERRLKAAVADYNRDVSDANDLIEKANDKMEAARRRLNAVLVAVEEFRCEVVAELEVIREGKSEDWEYTPEGKAFDQWITQWGFDASEVKEQDREKFDELDDGTDEMLSDAPVAPPEPQTSR